MAVSQLGSAMIADRSTQVSIQLKSQSPDIQLPEDVGPILVSTELRRYHLSTLVNRLLSNEKSIPFEFLINGQFLRTSLDDYLTANGISSETTLSVVYLRALIPPAHVASLQHDDWVSSVDVLSETSAAGREKGISSASERILSGCYDGLVRSWNASGDLKAVSQVGHSGGTKAVKFLSPTEIVSAGNDRTVRIWDYEDSADPSTSASITPSLELYGHTMSVDRLAVHVSSRSRILSASADKTIGLWSTTASSLPPAADDLIPQQPSKRRKIAGPKPPAVTRRGPLAILKGHDGPVSDVTFHPTDHTVAYSTSWDHSLKTWDLTTHTCVDTRTTAHSLLSVAAMPQVNLVAAGTSARHIALIDPRASATSIVPMTLRGHSNAAVSLSPNPTNGYVLASGSHDGSVRVWDVRSVKAGAGKDGGSVGESLFVFHREGGARQLPEGGQGVKVFGVVWDQKLGVVSCGEDKRVQVNRNEDG